MSIDTNLLIALSIIRDECWRHSRCRECPLQDKCIINPDGLVPRCWTIPEPPPEPTERQRIEWLRMLPDDEMLIAIEPFLKCANCQWHGVDCCNNDDMTCNNGHMKWWHEVVSLEQFRKDVGMNY